MEEIKKENIDLVARILILETKVLFLETELSSLKKKPELKIEHKLGIYGTKPGR